LGELYLWSRFSCLRPVIMFSARHGSLAARFCTLFNLFSLPRVSTRVVLSFWFILASPWHVKDLAHRQSLGPSAPANITTDNPTTVQHYSPSVVQSKHETTNYPAIVQHYPPSVVQSKHYPPSVVHPPMRSLSISILQLLPWTEVETDSSIFIVPRGLLQRDLDFHWPL
jgi:hypothetical protein